MDAPASTPRLAITAAADLHGHLPEIGACDLLLLAGDLVPYEIERDRDACREWFVSDFAAWLGAAGAPETIAIAGNHDFWAQDIPAGVHERLFGVDWTFLRDAETTTRSGLRVYGSPWTRDDYDSAFEAPSAELRRIWAPIPSGLDILLVHGPPRHHGDGLADGDDITHMGTDEMVEVIARTRPRRVVFGHAHQAHGYRAEAPEGTRLANVSVRTDYVGGLAGASAL